LIHESYSYWDENTEFSVCAFKDKASAIIYLKILSEKLINDALEINEHLVPNKKEPDDCDYIDLDEDRLYITIDEWGYEYVNIEEQDVMEMTEC
jgi:hypothetical protein